jgi:putative endonuclease
MLRFLQRDDKRTERRKKGDAFEDRALSFLEENGLVLVARNWQHASGEIDLVMRDAQTLVFVEVRKRSSAAFGSALQSIDHGKRLRLTRVADAYLARLPAQLPSRIDAISFDANDSPLWTKNILDR